MPSVEVAEAILAGHLDRQPELDGFLRRRERLGRDLDAQTSSGLRSQQGV